MNNQPLDSSPTLSPSNRRVGKARPTITPWGLMGLNLVFHGVMGLLLSIFSPPFWVWPLAFMGTLLQTVALAGPRALSVLAGVQILGVRFITCIGTALVVVGLAIAVGFGGTADIDSIHIPGTGLAILAINLGVLLLVATCSLLIARIGDLMLVQMGRTRVSLAILSVCFFGLFAGGALGLAIAST
ncbi:MAG: hypothetical protein F6K65_38810 [Moorea sp. SIO3C2]|nr:hypothetical protein [Moorena sp. SIO3C2]